MSKHLGDYDTSAVIYGKFTTFRPSTGASYTLGGSPVISVYKDNSTTQTTTGATLTADFDSVTGLNHFAIDTSADGTFYSAGSFFDIVITTGTVDSVSVVGATVASFTLRKDSSLKPTTAGRALDVSSGGEAGVDWANVGSPTTAVGLTNTTISTTQVIASVSGAVASVTNAVAITSNVKKNQALANFEFLMTDSTTHAPATGLTISATRSIDGASFGAGTLANAAEVANGIYKVDFGSGDLNGNVITLRVTATGADDTFVTLVTQP